MRKNGEFFPEPPCPILYQDNHLLAVIKPAGMPVQDDASGDVSLLVACRRWLKEAYRKPGNVYLGLIHRIDRPVQGLVLLAKTDKALRRMNESMRDRRVDRHYLAIVENAPPEEAGTLTHHLVKNGKLNRSFVVDGGTEPRGKFARLRYQVVGSCDRYFLLEVTLETGRHHQIRAQLAAVGSVVRGDLKYGAARSLPKGGIDLLSWKMAFQHPVGEPRRIELRADLPATNRWQAFAEFL